jgi:hypothetical protein
MNIHVEYSDDRKAWLPARQYQRDALTKIVMRNLILSSTIEEYDELEFDGMYELREVKIGDETFLFKWKRDRYPGKSMFYEDKLVKFTLCPISGKEFLVLKEDMSVGFLRWSGIVRLMANDDISFEIPGSRIPIMTQQTNGTEIDFFSQNPGYYMIANGREYRSLRDFGEHRDDRILQNPKIFIPRGQHYFIDVDEPQKILSDYRVGRGTYFKLFSTDDYLELSDEIYVHEGDGFKYFIQI